MTQDQAEAILAQVAAIREDVIELKGQARETREDIGEIKTQTTATNGRVKKLELWQARVEGARSVFSWVQPAIAAIVSGLVVGVVLALIFAAS